MSGVPCRDCGKDHEITYIAYLCDIEVIRRRNHISDCACDICRRVMAFEDALHERQAAQSAGEKP